MGIQQVITGFGKAADPQKVLSAKSKKTSDEDVKKLDESTSKDKIDLSEEGIKIDQMIKELDRTRAGIKDDPQVAIKAQSNVSTYGALEVLDDTFGSVYAQLDTVKEDIAGDSKSALQAQNNLTRKSVFETISG
jgi:transcriptional regulatory protein LevR